jgi:O-antigen ligase
VRPQFFGKYSETMSGSYASDQSDSKLPLRQRLARGLGYAIEGLVVSLIVLSPWFYGGARSGFEFLIDAGIALLLVLWGAKICVEGRLSWRACPVAGCLAAIFLYGLWQLAPLSTVQLAWLSPSTAKIYQQLIPAKNEVLPSNLTRDKVSPATGTTISVYPTATRQALIRLLTVFLLFVAVQNNMASLAALRRLAYAAVVNGALLTLLGFLQFFSSPSNTLYWSYPSLGQVFGPFINRNHFAMYINLCIGLGLGLLLDCSKSKTWSRGNAAWFAHSAVPWIVLSLSLMVSGVAFSLSRGGLLALAVGLALCATTVIIHSGQLVRLLPALLGVVGAIALLAWFGFSRVEARLATLWGADLQESRIPVWRTACRIGQEFPIWGTGFGTFASVELMYRDYAPPVVGYLAVHAHNEYLEALAEGGVVGLALTVALVGLIAYLGWRPIRNSPQDPAAGLALGALAAFTMLVTHSIVEFGIHIPAIALLATVLVAQLSSLTSTEKRAEMQFGGLVPWLGAAAVCVLGLVILNEGWRRYGVDWSLYLSARPLESGAAPTPERRIELLRVAAQLSPGDARVPLELAKAYFDLFDREEALGVYSNAELTREYLAPALRSLLHARDACPVLAEPHILLALHVESLPRADSRSAYLQRVKMLAPTDPDVWYLCGQQELLLDKAPEQAWVSWRRSLEFGEGRLPEILVASAEHLSPLEISQKILPDRPSLLIQAAGLLFPTPEDAARRQPLLERALAVLEANPESHSPEELHTKAELLVRLGHSESAVSAYQAALAEKPLQFEWRYGLAKTLFDLGRLQDSRRELRLILGQQPKHAAAGALENEIARAIAEGRAE